MNIITTILSWFSKTYKVIGLIYSGKPNPSWQISQANVDSAMAIWNNQPVAQAWQTITDKLGYTGCQLSYNGSIYQACDGIIVCTTGSKQVARIDPNRAFEKILLTNAPKSVLQLTQ